MAGTRPAATFVAVFPLARGRDACDPLFTILANGDTLFDMKAHRSRAILPLIAAFVLGLVAPAHARRGLSIPLQVRITAYVNEKLEGIKPDFEWTVSHDTTTYRLYILNLVSMDGRATGLDIDNAVSLYTPNFRIAGDSSEIQKLINAAPRQQIVITAYLNFAGGARMMMISRVETAPPPTAAPKEF